MIRLVFSVAACFALILTSSNTEFFPSRSSASLPQKTDVVNPKAFQARTYRSARGETMPYRIFIPRDYDSRKKYPVILWLHGGGGRGNDNLKQISEGNTSGSHIWISENAQSKYPSFVLAPQCPEDQMWTTVETAKSTRQLGLALEILAAIEKEFAIDTRRRYVAGQSMGGLGSWSLITEHPGMFAAAIPVCGGGNEKLARKLVKTAIWAFHGTLDQAISVERTGLMIAAVRSAGGHPKYTEYTDLGHNIWNRAFHEVDLLDWVFAQTSKTMAATSGSSKHSVFLTCRYEKHPSQTIRQT